MFKYYQVGLMLGQDDMPIFHWLKNKDLSVGLVPCISNVLTYDWLLSDEKICSGSEYLK